MRLSVVNIGDGNEKASGRSVMVGTTCVLAMLAACLRDNYHAGCFSRKRKARYLKNHSMHPT